MAHIDQNLWTLRKTKIIMGWSRLRRMKREAHSVIFDSESGTSLTSTTNEPGVLIEAPIEGRDDLANLKASIESIGFAFRCVDYTADADGENELLEALLVYVGEND